MFGFLTFVIIMSFTPGPNTIMAMSEGQQKGFRHGLIFNSGIFLGMLIIGGIVTIFASFFQNYPTIILVLKIIGSLYLLYLAYHTYISTPGDASAAGNHPLVTGLLLQATNIKVYLYFITGMGTFIISGIFGALPVKLTLMVLLGVLGTLAWTAAGQLIQAFYSRHFKLLNTFVALLLVFSAYDLWR